MRFTYQALLTNYSFLWNVCGNVT